MKREADATPQGLHEAHELYGGTWGSHRRGPSDRRNSWGTQIVLFNGHLMEKLYIYIIYKIIYIYIII